MANDETALWAAITMDDASGELDVTLWDSQKAAQAAILDELVELYADLGFDVPTDYDVEEISSWCADNLIRFNWRIKPISKPYFMANDDYPSDRTR